MTDTVVRPLVIVGSGPAGLTAAIYAGRAGLRPLVIEGSFTAGGALMTTTEVENYPGFPDGIQGPDLMAAMRAQAAKFGAEFLIEDATRIHLSPSPKQITDSSGNVHQAKAIILAMGSSYRRLGIKAEDRLAAKGVSWCATCDGFFFRDKAIAVVGGGDVAIEEALFLTRFATKVTIVHRRDKLRASEIMAKRAAENPKIDFAWNSEIIDMTGETKLDGLVLRDTVTGDQRHLAVEGLFEAIGSIPQSELVATQLDVDQAGYVIIKDPSTATSIEGVFACGDLVDPIYRQAINAAGTGCRAAIDAQRWLAR